MVRWSSGSRYTVVGTRLRWPMYNVFSIVDRPTIGNCVGSDSRCSSTSCEPDATVLVCKGCDANETSLWRVHCSGPVPEEQPRGLVSGTGISVIRRRSALRSRIQGSLHLKDKRDHFSAIH